MKELVFLVEGEAERNLLSTLLPRLLPSEIHFRVIPFQGKQDLEKRMHIRIRAYQNSLARFVVMRDQDSHPDCKTLKQELWKRCLGTGRENHCLIRIACTEVETFYLADLIAVADAFNMPSLRKHQQERKYRNPDLLGTPSRELKKLTQNCYEKRAGSREIGLRLDIENTRSSSFKHFVSGVRRLSDELIKQSV